MGVHSLDACSTALLAAGRMAGTCVENAAPKHDESGLAARSMGAEEVRMEEAQTLSPLNVVVRARKWKSLEHRTRRHLRSIVWCDCISEMADGWNGTT